MACLMVSHICFMRVRARLRACVRINTINFVTYYQFCYIIANLIQYFVKMIHLI